MNQFVIEARRINTALAIRWALRHDLPCADAVLPEVLSA